jgi:imidazolonepropionase-like amidohydrolase
MTQIILENARVFDGVSEDCPEGMSVLVEDGTIREVSEGPIGSDEARRIDVAGKTLMPGLIDMHVHSYFSDLDPRVLNDRDAPYRTAYAIRKLGHALDSGFTTVRDIGGGDYPLAAAIADHVDYRTPNEKHHTHGYCSCDAMNWAGVIADGVDECIKATREELRRGAHCIKIVASGGVMSPSDPIWMNQFREDEIRAIVQECVERRTYVSAHCLTSESTRRSVEFGVRCIEHAAQIDAETAAFVAERGAYVVPTMVCLYSLVEQGLEMGLPGDRMDKLRAVYDDSMTGLDVMRSAGVKLAFGTDLLAGFYPQQTREFELRREVFSPVELLRQATSVGAEILMQEGRLGCVQPGAHADLIVVDGDPLKDVGLLAAEGRNLDLVMRGGEVVKNRLG